MTDIVLFCARPRFNEMMLGFAGVVAPQLSALDSFADMGLLTVRTVADSSELFEDAFDDFEAKPTDLLPEKTVLEKGMVEVPATKSTYVWSKLFGEKKMIRLVHISHVDS